VPAGSKMDPLLATAEPISDGGSVSMITYLRREKKMLNNNDSGVKICERNNSGDYKVS